MSILNEPPRHRTYLLTIWEERSRDSTLPTLWRFSLKDPDTGQRRGFARLEEVMAFLSSELAGGPVDQTDQ